MEAKRNNSRKRQAVLDAIRATKSHPTAESVYNAVKPVVPEISLGTVYRNISVLESEGTIISVGTVDGQARYDGRTDDHAHLVCRRCGFVLDVEMKFNVGEMFGAVDEMTGALAERYSLCFYGLCPQCRESD